jgi:hypothetical protein
MPWTNPITGTTYRFLWEDAPAGSTSPTPLTTGNLDQMQADGQKFATATAASVAAYVDAEIAAEATAQASTLAAETSARQAADALMAAMASPTFTGVVTVPTPSASDDSSAAASTAWIQEYVTAAVDAAFSQYSAPAAEQ